MLGLFTFSYVQYGVSAAVRYVLYMSFLAFGAYKARSVFVCAFLLCSSSCKRIPHCAVDVMSSHARYDC